MVVAFYTLMLADCSPFSRLLERLWGINWNGSTRSWGEPRTCCNLLEPDSTQFVGPVGATLDGKILTTLRSDLPRNLYIVKHLVKHFVKHVVKHFLKHVVKHFEYLEPSLSSEWEYRYESVWICWMCQGPLGTTVLTSPWLSRWENGCVQLGQHGGSSPRLSVYVIYYIYNYIYICNNAYNLNVYI